MTLAQKEKEGKMENENVKDRKKQNVKWEKKKRTFR